MEGRQASACRTGHDIAVFRRDEVGCRRSQREGARLQVGVASDTPRCGLR